MPGREKGQEFFEAIVTKESKGEKNPEKNQTVEKSQVHKKGEEKVKKDETEVFLDEVLKEKP